MSVFEAIGTEGHEEVVFGSDPVSGLKTIIAIHSTALGPALGGTRFFPYDSEDQALSDVLRLSKAMTLKAAVAGLDLGGGKAVIMGDPASTKSERLWRAYGRIIDSLHGRYITAEDVGTDHLDMTLIRRETRWVMGTPEAEGGSGDPSPATARGLMRAIDAVADVVWNDPDIAGRRFAVQGVGKVGRDLVRRLVERDARVVVADVSEEAIEYVSQTYGVDAVSVDEIYEVACDVLAPCSLGGVINKDTVPRLKCSVVLGSANNQLEDDKDAERLRDAGILYCPDFVVNAGGLVNVFEESRGYKAERAAFNIDRIYGTTRTVLEQSAKRDCSPLAMAHQLAQERLARIGQLRLFRRSGDDRN